MVLPLLITVPAMPVAPAIDLTAETSTHSSASQGGRHHTVRDGETAYDIAARYGVSPRHCSRATTCPAVTSSTRAKS